MSCLVKGYYDGDAEGYRDESFGRVVTTHVFLVVLLLGDLEPCFGGAVAW